MKVLITGAKGYLGRSMFTLAPCNWEVEPLQRGARILTPHKYDLVVHCAAVHPRSVPPPTLETYLDSNVRMVKEIVEVTKGESCRLIFISTSYLNVQELLGADKNQLNLYAASKAMAETYLRTEELSFFGVYVLRLPVLLSSGPQANSFLDVAFQVISGGEPLTLYNAKEPFPVTDAEEVMAMVRCLAKKGPKGFHVITLGARDTLSLEEIIESFKEGFSPSGGHQSMIGRRGSDVLTNPFLQEIGFKASTSFEIVSRFMKKAIGPINATT